MEALAEGLDEPVWSVNKRLEWQVNASDGLP